MKKEKLFIFFSLLIGSAIALGLVLNAIQQRQETRKEAAVDKTITISLSPEEITKKPGETFDIDVILSTTATKQIRVAGTDLQFSPDVFEVSSISCNTTNFPLAIQNQGENNKILLTCSKQGGQEPLILTPDSSITLGTIRLQVKTGAPLGTTSITFLRANVPEAAISENLVNQTVEARYTIASSGPTSTLTPDTPVLNFKIKFDGVNNNIGTQKVTVKVKKDNLETTFSQAEVVSNNQGVLTGNLILNEVDPGASYTISIKGPKHLSTKFCKNRQKTSCSPGQALPLKAGENIFDFSTSPLLAGDIPDENGVQDGIVDTQKFSLLKQALVSSDSGLKSRCNLDFNKDASGNDVINGRDIVLFLKTLSIRYDDE